MVTGTWPFPGDAPVTVARKIAAAYRQALHLHAPEVGAELDRTMVDWGQTWVVPRVRRFDLDDWIGVADAADIAGVRPDTIGDWRRRDRVIFRQVDGRYEYLVRSVYAASSNPRWRRSNSKETTQESEWTMSDLRRGYDA